MHHVTSERAACGKMAAVCGRRPPLASSADETSSLYMISMVRTPSASLRCRHHVNPSSNVSDWCCDFGQHRNEFEWALLQTIESLSPAPPFPARGTLFRKKYVWKSMARDNLSFYSVWTVPWITHMMFVNLKDYYENRLFGGYLFLS